MACSKRRTALFVGVNVVVGSLCVLDASGMMSVKQASLRGARRLQQTFGQQVMGNVGQGVQQGSGVVDQGLQFGHSVGQQYGGDAWKFGTRAQDTWNAYDPRNQATSVIPQGIKVAIPILQAIFAVLYYCMVVNNYPYWNGPTPQSCQIQGEPAPCALMSTSPTNCCLSWLCPQARAAHTFDKTGTLEYWCGCLAMFICPFCTLCWANACTDLNPKLGGQPANAIASAACTWCCSCCVIAQDAESLDACTGARTECCGVSGGMPAYGAQPYPGMMMQPGMMQPGMMQPGMMQPGMMQPGMMQPGMY